MSGDPLPDVVHLCSMWQYLCKSILLFLFVFVCCRITNSPVADVFVVWARSDEGPVRGFILDKVGDT